jgi:hypothetical protein
MDRTEARIVAMSQRVCHRLAKSPAIDRGDGHPEESDLQFALGRSSSKEFFHSFEHPEEWAAHEFVDANLCSLDDLECHLMTRYMVAEGGFSPEKQQTSDSRNAHAAVAADERERRVKLRVLQGEKRTVTTISVDRTTEALAFGRIEITATRPAQRNRGRI